MYWGVEQEELVYQWLSANTLQQFQIYQALKKSVKYMAGSILGRYFIPTQDHDEIRQDAINHLFCQLHRFNPNLGHTAYAYCQTILKNYYHEVCRNKAKTHVIKLEYYDDLECPEFEYSFTYDPFIEEQHYDFQPIFKRLEQARYTLMSYLADHKKLNQHTRKRINSEINFLSHSTEYLYEYRDSQGLSISSMHEYTMHRTGVCEDLARRYMQKHFGVSSYLKEDWKSKIDEKYQLDVIDDDYVPNEGVNERKVRRAKIKEQYKLIQYHENHE